MDKNELKEILNVAVSSLFANQPNIFSFTSESGQTEWNLAHHLANEISKALPKYNCDLEITKADFESRRPDIIFHERGTHRNNFLVIEMKRDGNVRDIENDTEKIMAYWFADPLSYQFGAVINIYSDKKFKIDVLTR
jgi:hypothetical protein